MIKKRLKFSCLFDLFEQDKKTRYSCIITIDTKSGTDYIGKVVNGDKTKNRSEYIALGTSTLMVKDLEEWSFKMALGDLQYVSIKIE